MEKQQQYANEPPSAIGTRTIVARREEEAASWKLESRLSAHNRRTFAQICAHLSKFVRFCSRLFAFVQLGQSCAMIWFSKLKPVRTVDLRTSSAFSRPHQMHQMHQIVHCAASKLRAPKLQMGKKYPFN